MPKRIRENQVESYGTREVETRGGEVRKVSWQGRAHAPDRLLLLAPISCFVEFKRPGELPSAGQIREHRRLRRAGFRVEVISTYAGVDALMAEYDARTGGGLV